MAIVISDANIFIDMAVANLTREMFELPDSFVVPDVLYREELEEFHPELPEIGLRVQRLEAVAVEETIRLRTIYAEPSLHDLMALVLAKMESCPLLTGDSQLRHAAKAERVDVRGTLWLMEAMLSENVIDIDRMVKGYDLMRHGGRRLPWSKVTLQLSRLQEEPK